MTKTFRWALFYFQKDFWKPGFIMAGKPETIFNSHMPGTFVTIKVAFNNDNLGGF